MSVPWVTTWESPMASLSPTLGTPMSTWGHPPPPPACSQCPPGSPYLPSTSSLIALKAQPPSVATQVTHPPVAPTPPPQSHPLDTTPPLSLVHPLLPHYTTPIHIRILYSTHHHPQVTVAIGPGCTSQVSEEAIAFRQVSVNDTFCNITYSS